MIQLSRYNDYEVLYAVHHRLLIGFSKFAEVVELNGEIQATHEQVLTVFLQLSKKERKLVMAEGSIRSFLSKCPYIDVAGNTLSMVEEPQSM